MKNVSYLALFSTLLLLIPLCALAREKNEHSVDFLDPVQVGTTQLKPGSYKVEWQEAGPAVHVEFLQHGKVVATIPGTLKRNDQQVVQDDVVTQTIGANTRVLREIDFSHQKESLLFGQHQGGM